jgi:carbon monoxide dehydrogenase subunit G
LADRELASSAKSVPDVLRKIIFGKYCALYGVIATTGKAGVPRRLWHNAPPSSLETSPRFGDTPLLVRLAADRIQLRLNKLSTAPNYHPVWRCLLSILLALPCLFATQAHAEADQAIDVDVHMRGGQVLVDVDFHVRATPQEVWAVITDYDHATAFISKLEKSVILSRTDEMLLVSQKGTVGYGPFSVKLETVMEIHLTPFEKMQSHLVSGNMKKNEATTRLIADASGTRVVYHLESIPNVWLPPLIGHALVEFETRARFRQVVEEILRRKALSEVKR